MSRKRTADSEVISRSGCGPGCNCSSCCRPKGKRGATGPTGASPSEQCCQIGLHEFSMEGIGTLTITESMLHNTSFAAGVRYREIVLTGTSLSDPTLIIPKPTGNDVVFNLIIENRCGNSITIGNGSGATFVLVDFSVVEKSLEQEIVNGAVGIFCYRTDVSSRPAGVYRVPGFAGTS